MTQSIPAITRPVVPAPSSSSTRTETIRARLATPYVAPATVAAMCVPCPLPSAAVRSPSTKSRPYRARPPNSRWLTRTPVSRT